MCLHGVYKEVRVVNPYQNKKVVVIDACIADEIQELNTLGVITLACCCGHGKTGEISEWKNEFGSWKAYELPPHVLIDNESVQLSKKLGYRPFPYVYADGKTYNTWLMFLKTGCMTREECTDWHIGHSLKIEENIGVII